jgi:hypothetical protein
MSENQGKQSNLVDTTDCLEAIGVFKGWRNGLFIIMIICLILQQGSFWLVDSGCVKADYGSKCEKVAVVGEKAGQGVESIVPAEGQKGEVEKAAEQVAGEAKPTSEAATQKAQGSEAASIFEVKFKHLVWVIRPVNFLLILTAMLYCLTTLFSLKVSLVGRLGGINHISRAFFLSLVTLIVLLPWRVVFDNVFFGAMYTPSELLYSCTVAGRADMLDIISHYLRFSGYWLVVVLLLISSQIRNSRWSKAILRRLEVV